MLDVVLSLLGIVFVLAVVCLVIVLPLWAFARTRELPGLRARVERLEREVGRLRRAEAPALTVPASVSVQPPPEEEILTAVPVAPGRPRPAPPRRADAATLEAWIGRQGMGWAAVVLLLFTAAFFLDKAGLTGILVPGGRAEVARLHETWYLGGGSHEGLEGETDYAKGGLPVHAVLHREASGRRFPSPTGSRP